MEKATFGGGCFWHLEEAFRQMTGVVSTRVGYMGGAKEHPTYEEVCSHTTGHAEVVEVTFDPGQVSYDKLLRVFWDCHDPTQLNRQGPDRGTQYRSAIFYTSEEQHKAALSYIRQLNAAHTFHAPIVTQVAPLQQFYAAEEYHQNYLALHPYQPYIVFNDMPKVEQLRKQFPALYRKE